MDAADIISYGSSVLNVLTELVVKNQTLQDALDDTSGTLARVKGELKTAQDTNSALQTSLTLAQNANNNLQQQLLALRETA